jgi:uncharacterized protein (TIGR02271 family)
MRTITALYDNRADAEEVVERLVSVGVGRQDISLVQQESSTTGSTASTQQESGGFLDSLANLFMPDDDRTTYSEGVRRGGVLLSARVDDDRVDEAIDVLERSSAVDVDSRAEEWRSSGWSSGGVASTAADATAGYGDGLREDTSRTTTTTTTAGYEAGATTSSRDALSEAASVVGTRGATSGGVTAGYSETDTTGMGAARVRDDGVVERAEEQIRVGKREVGRGTVRVRSYVVETPVEEQVTLQQERVHVERRPVDRPVGTGDAVFQERVIEATERSEEAVVAKEARVVEEIGLRKEADTRTETVRDTVRRQEVEVEDDRTARGVTGGTTTTTAVETDVTGMGTTTDRSRTGGL